MDLGLGEEVVLEDGSTISIGAAGPNFELVLLLSVYKNLKEGKKKFHNQSLLFPYH